MSERDSPDGGIERRGVLAALATGIGGVGVARSSLASETGSLDSMGYVVEQGDRCVPITPLSGDETAEAFYDYRTPNTSPSGPAYSSYGTTDLQRPETSVCFLYDGPEGLSLVLLHDKLHDGTNGGAVTFRLDLENPDRGAWVVRDDGYDAATNYDTFAPTEDGWRVDWTWAEGRSDGGVYRPLGDDFRLTIHPAFNEDAALYGDHYEGRITDWQVLSGDRTDPDRFSLALDRPLTIRPGSCGGQTTPTTTTETETTTEEGDEGEQDDGQSSEPISPEVELVPGKVNPESHGRLPVVVRSTDGFDATDLARGSIAFGPAGKSERASPVKRIRTDADGDGRRDLKLHFWMDATGIDRGTEAVRLTGETESGRQVEAVAEVELVPNGDDDHEEREDDESEAEDDDHEEREEESADGEEREEDDEEREEDEEESEDDDDEEDEEEDDKDEDDEEEDDDEREEDEEEDEDDREDEDDDREDDDDWKEDDDSGHPGRGNGKGRGRGRGNGKGRGRGRGKGRDD